MLAGLESQYRESLEGTRGPARFTHDSGELVSFERHVMRPGRDPCSQRVDGWRIDRTGGKMIEGQPQSREVVGGQSEFEPAAPHGGIMWALTQAPFDPGECVVESPREGGEIRTAEPDAVVGAIGLIQSELEGLDGDWRGVKKPELPEDAGRVGRASPGAAQDAPHIVRPAFEPIKTAKGAFEIIFDRCRSMLEGLPQDVLGGTIMPRVDILRGREKRCSREVRARWLDPAPGGLGRLAVAPGKLALAEEDKHLTVV